MRPRFCARPNRRTIEADIAVDDLAALVESPLKSSKNRWKRHEMKSILHPLHPGPVSGGNKGLRISLNPRKMGTPWHLKRHLSACDRMLIGQNSRFGKMQPIEKKKVGSAFSFYVHLSFAFRRPSPPLVLRFCDSPAEHSGETEFSCSVSCRCHGASHRKAARLRSGAAWTVIRRSRRPGG